MSARSRSRIRCVPPLTSRLCSGSPRQVEDGVGSASRRGVQQVLEKLHVQSRAQAVALVNGEASGRPRPVCLDLALTNGCECRLRLSLRPYKMRDRISRPPTAHPGKGAETGCLVDNGQIPCLLPARTSRRGHLILAGELALIYVPFSPQPAPAVAGGERGLKSPALPSSACGKQRGSAVPARASSSASRHRDPQQRRGGQTRA